MVHLRICRVVIVCLLAAALPLRSHAHPQTNFPPLKAEKKNKSSDVTVEVKHNDADTANANGDTNHAETGRPDTSDVDLDAIARVSPEAAKKLADALVENKLWYLQHERPSDGIASNAADAEEHYTAWQNGYLEKIYNHQYCDTIVIFWVANLLVTFGIAFAAIQFWTTLKTQDGKHTLQQGRAMAPEKSATDADGKPQAPPDDPVVTSISLSADGFSIKSSFLGVVILAISMLFYFGYIKYVYPISIASPKDIGTATSTPPKP